MGVIARDDKQFTLIYSSNTRVGRKTIGYVKGGTGDKLQLIDIAEVKMTGTQWAEIADMLGKSIGDLVDKRVMNEDVETVEKYDDNDWIKILQHNDEVLSQPIAINGDEIMQVIHPADVLNFFSVDSAGLKKTMHTEEPTIKPTTKGERFKTPLSKSKKASD